VKDNHGPNYKAANGALIDLKTAFSEGGTRGAIAYLNSRTQHRFTSLFRFDGATLRNITFYDRENPSIDECEDIPVEASYCVFVRDMSRKFIVENAESDVRVNGHPKQPTVKFYCGVPLLDRYGKMFGSICHFDLEPGRIAEGEVELLEYMADLLKEEY
jgi:GAF domain-containing protein